MTYLCSRRRRKGSRCGRQKADTSGDGAVPAKARGRAASGQLRPSLRNFLDELLKLLAEPSDKLIHHIMAARARIFHTVGRRLVHGQRVSLTSRRAPSSLQPAQQQQ